MIHVCYKYFNVDLYTVINRNNYPENILTLNIQELLRMSASLRLSRAQTTQLSVRQLWLIESKSHFNQPHCWHSPPQHTDVKQMLERYLKFKVVLSVAFTHNIAFLEKRLTMTLRYLMYGTGGLGHSQRQVCSTSDTSQGGAGNHEELHQQKI